MSTLARVAGWWIADYAYAAYWQCRAVIGRHDPAEYVSGSGTPVVVIPGIWETWAFLRPIIREVHAQGNPVYVLPVLHRNGRPVVETAKVVAAFILDNDLRGVLVLAHSKGGLIGKYVMALLDDTRRVSSMVAVCAPFSGSRYATHLPLGSLRAFSPLDVTTLALLVDTAVNARIVSVYGQFDPHIPEGSKLVGARNVELPTGGHFRILAQRETIDLILAEARRTPS